MQPLHPLLPALVPARSMACSMFSVVSTPKATGMSYSIITWARPFAVLARYQFEVVGTAADDGAECDDGVVLTALGQLLGRRGISTAPGTRTRVRLLSLDLTLTLQHVSAPFTRLSLMKLLKRATTIATRASERRYFLR